MFRRPADRWSRTNRSSDGPLARHWRLQIAESGHAIDLELLCFALHLHRRQLHRIDAARDLTVGVLGDDDFARRGDVDGVTDRGVLEGARRTDRSGNDVTGVDADADANRRLVLGSAGAVELLEALQHRDG